MLARIKACLGVIYQAESQQVLLACRPAGKVLAGYWEFPGGKLEANEDCFMALRRELNEEIGILVADTAMEYLGAIEHQYPHGLAQLDIVLVPEWEGEIYACEGQELCWYSLIQPTNLEPLLPTTAAILELLEQRNHSLMLKTSSKELKHQPEL